MAQTVDFTYSNPSNLFCSKQIITFKQNCTGAPLLFKWSFGNGEIGTNSTETVTYSTFGTYKVTLTATYADTIISASKDVIINPLPTISFAVDTIKQCKTGDIALSVTSSADVVKYDWTFGDGSPSQSISTNAITHNFTTYNNFKVIVNAATAKGCFSPDTLLVQIKKIAVVGRITSTDSCIPVTATLQANASFLNGDFATQFVWDLGDLTPIITNNSSVVNHVYPTTDSFSHANVIITTNDGCTVQYNYKPIAYGTPTIASIQKKLIKTDSFCASQIVSFVGSAPLANKYRWQFGDGSVSYTTLTTITHKYNSLGLKQVILTPYFNGCQGKNDTAKIYIKGIFARVSTKVNCAAKNNYSLTNQSIPVGHITSFKWLFSDDLSIIDSVNYNTTHIFPTSGKFATTLIIFDSVTSCYDTSIVNIFTATPSFSSTKTSVCKDSLVTYSVSNSYDSLSNYLYEFHVNGKIINNGVKTTLNYFPKNMGTFADSIRIVKYNTQLCYDTLILPSIKVGGPVDTFSIPKSVCVGTPITVTNLSTPFFATDPIVTWHWNFGDNGIDSVQNPSTHIYQKSGNYNISILATDINGCSQKKSSIISINPLPQIFVFPASNTLCSGKTVSLIANTNAPNIVWSPLQNLSCSNCNVTIANPTTTTAYIATATDANGCKQIDSSIIKVIAPFTLTVAPANRWVCVNQPVTFTTNFSDNITWSPTTYLTKDGNGNMVSIPTAPIKYTISRVDSAGCFVDTTYANIFLYSQPSVNAGADQLLPYGSTYTINPIYSNDIISYNWSPSTDLSCTFCATPTANVLNGETYIVNVKNAYGCIAADTIIINVACEQNNLLLPTAFTPNGDGLNDYFYPIARGYKIVNKFLVYNRLGEKVFERNNFLPNIANLGWNGKLKNNSKLVSQTFVWYIEATCIAGQRVYKKGTIISLP